MKRTLSVLACALALVMVAMAFAGCGTPQSTPSSTPAASQSVSQAESDAPADDGPVSLRVSWWGSDGRHEATLAAMEAYMAAHPNVTIEGEFQGWDGYEEKLATQVAGGTMADISQITGTRMVELAKKSDVFAPVKEYTDYIDISGFDDEFLAGNCTVDGVLMALPTGVNARSFFLNTLVCDAAGVELGENFTWDEFIAEGAKVNQNNPEQYMIICSSDDWYQMSLVHYRQQTGIDMITDDMAMDVDEAALQKTYEMIRAMYDNNVVEPVETSYVYNSGQAENKKWLEGDIGCVYFTASSYGQFENSNVAMEGHNPPVAADAVTSGFSAQPSQVWAVTKNDNAAESYKLLNYFFNEDEGIEILGDVRSVPPVAKARELLASKDLLEPAISQAVSRYLDKGEGSPSAIMQNTEIQQATYSIIDELAYNTITPEQAVAKTIEQYTRILASLG